MLKKSELQPTTRRPDPAPAITPEPRMPAAPQIDVAALGEMQKAMGQLAKTMSQIMWQSAAHTPPEPVKEMDVDIIRDKDGKMSGLKVKVVR